MKYKAEIFDKFQYLYYAMGFSDHQVRCEITYEDKVNEAVMEKAARLLLATVPALSRKYVNLGSKSYWADADISDYEGLFRITYRRDEFDRFLCSKTDEENGPQIKLCLLREKNDTLAVLLNHMVSDGAGFKQCLYLFSEIYSGLINNSDYTPGFTVNGDRGLKGILGNIGLRQKARSFLFGHGDNNQKSNDELFSCKRASAEPFIVSHEIPRDLFNIIKAFCHASGATVNDVILASYVRAISEMLHIGGKEIAVPIMVDMRRYLQDKSFYSLTNLSSTSIVKLRIPSGEELIETISKTNAIMAKKKEKGLGINTFLKLHLGFKVPLVNAYEIMRKVLKNPKISMTNIGVIDSSKLVFSGSDVKNAVIYASIKYLPYFQISVTSFNDAMTLGAGLYGNEEDKVKIENLLMIMEKDLYALKLHAK
jgi:NRPS condensation-like uncharacterized protein